MPSSRPCPTASRAPRPSRAGLDAAATAVLKRDWMTLATYSFCWGGLHRHAADHPAGQDAWAGARCTPIYFAGSALALLATFGLDLPAETRLRMYFFIGLTVFGVFGSFTFYLPELYPDAPAVHRQRLLLQHRPRGDGRRRVRRRHDPADRPRAIPKSSCARMFMIGFVPIIGLAAAALGHRDPRPEDAGLIRVAGPANCPGTAVSRTQG